MNPILISKQDLISSGWTPRAIDACLDAPDEYGPSRHWLNTYGTPYFAASRVEIAAFRSRESTNPPRPEYWTQWKASHSPSSPPVATFDFHRLCEASLPGSATLLSGLRLSHPILGRRPGDIEEETLLIERTMAALFLIAFEKTVLGSKEIEHFLGEIARTARQSLGRPWGRAICIRGARIKSYISSATSKKAIRRFLYTMALVHSGQILSPSGEKQTVFHLLQRSPALRFDLLELDTFLER